MDVQIQNLQGVRWAHGCWVGMGQMWAPTQLQNCTSSIISYQFCGDDHLHPHPFLYWVWLFGHPQNQKYHCQRIYISGNQQQQCKFWGGDIFLEDFGLKFACQNLIHQHNNNFLWSFQRPKHSNHKLNDCFCDHSRWSVFFPIIDPDFWAILGFYLRTFFLKFRRFYLL